VNIWRIDANGGNLLEVTQGSLDQFGTCSPDGKWFAYTSADEVKFAHRHGKIRKIALGTLAVVRETGLCGPTTHAGDCLGTLVTGAAARGGAKI